MLPYDQIDWRKGDTAFDCPYLVQLDDLGRLGSLNSMIPFGAKLWPLLDVNTMRVSFGLLVLAEARTEGRRDLVNTKCPTTFVPYSKFVSCGGLVPIAYRILGLFYFPLEGP